MFAILQKYDFSSKSQHCTPESLPEECCLRYCKSTIFQANHNLFKLTPHLNIVVCDTAKVRFFKQITTYYYYICIVIKLFAILQKYDFSSKSQLSPMMIDMYLVVCDTAKVRFFKQITTHSVENNLTICCLRYCKSTIFQANHNWLCCKFTNLFVVCDTAKVRFFKQITTTNKFR